MNKPTPPEPILECNTCGYRAPESQYNHRYCTQGILIWSVAAVLIVVYVTVIMITIFNKNG